MGDDAQRALQRLRDHTVLVVEDEAVIAMHLEDILTSGGVRVVGPAPRVARARELLHRSRPDLALLDVNLGGEKVFPFAEDLAAAGIPFAFATGYGQAGLPAIWQLRPVIHKPFTQPEVFRGLLQALEGPAVSSA